MARHSWETDAGVPRSGGSRVLRVLVGLLFVGAATFIAAYYVPLFRAHQALVKVSAESTSKAEALEQKVKKLQTELGTVTEARDKLSQAESERASTSKAGKDRLTSLETEVSNGVKKSAAKASATVTAGEDSVRVSLKSDALFPGDKPELNQAAASVLCDVSRAAGTHRLEVVLGTQSLVPAAGDSAWAGVSEAAGRIATHLDQRCGRKSGLTVAVSGDAASSVAAHTVELRVYP